MTLGEKIKAARLARNLTQRELVGDYITRNMLSKIENDAAAPSVRTLEYLAHVLALPMGYFLDNENGERSAPDGLDACRAAYRAEDWQGCLNLLEADPVAAATDEGFLLQALAGARAARAALEAGRYAEAEALAQTARVYNREGMYGTPTVEYELLVTLGGALRAMGLEASERHRAALQAALDELSLR